jgi:predicted RNase H-like HicB family nuclease
MSRYDILMEKDEDGYYLVTVPQLPGCHTQAKSIGQALERIEEAIALYLEN